MKNARYAISWYYLQSIIFELIYWIFTIAVLLSRSVICCKAMIKVLMQNHEWFTTKINHVHIKRMPTGLWIAMEFHKTYLSYGIFSYILNMKMILHFQTSLILVLVFINSNHITSIHTQDTVRGKLRLGFFLKKLETWSTLLADSIAV